MSAQTNIYQTSFYVSIANLPGNVLAAWATERFGRKFTLVGSCFASGLAVFCIWFVGSPAGVTLFACLFAAVSVGAWNALDVVAVELFPTPMRTTAFGVQAAAGRLGAVVGNALFGQVSLLSFSVLQHRPTLNSSVFVTSLAATGLRYR